MSQEEAQQSVIRQSITLPGSSCDMRIGKDALYNMGRELRLLVGKPRKAALICGADVSGDLAEELCRQLSDGGFAAAEAGLPANEHITTLDIAHELFIFLSNEGITADDVLVFAGNEQVAGLASYIASAWCGGMEFAFVPTTALGAVQGITTPPALSATAVSAPVVATKARPRMAFCDLTYMDLTGEEQFQTALAYAVSTAVCDNTDAFGRLAEKAQKIMEHDEQTIVDQLVDTIKCRGRIEASTSLAIRQSNSYGFIFEAALDHLFDGIPRALKIAEGLRVNARLSVGLEEADMDLMYSQDALLTSLGIGQIACEVQAQELIDALKAVCFARTNRFLLPLPLAMGRVRYTAVPDELLYEHLQAWCVLHKQLLSNT
ncbi:dehydroquinate synthase/iron-containing alcohol dehydrogenase family protein [Atopobium fossor]|uniref:hypothetical protein n=1 Tax=Atopobium fossor TaxID=39487 RepID=UPI0003F60C07|nr:hypothetical protein [Atopobium fossor]